MVQERDLDLNERKAYGSYCLGLILFSLHQIMFSPGLQTDNFRFKYQLLLYLNFIQIRLLKFWLFCIL